MTEHERRIDEIVESKGLSLLTDGWPDRLCFKQREDGTLEVLCIEIKTSVDEVKLNQTLCHKILAAAGIPIFVVREEKDLENLSGRICECLEKTCNKEWIDDLEKRLESNIHFIVDEMKNIYETFRALRELQRRLDTRIGLLRKHNAGFQQSADKRVEDMRKALQVLRTFK